MTKRQRVFAVSAAVAASAVGLALPAGAHRFHGFGFRPPFGHGRPPVLNPQAKPVCLRNCGQLESLCLSGARNDARMCSDSTCSVERQAAHDACIADHRSDACDSARSALRTCLQPCRDALKSTGNTCRSDRRTCVATCGTSMPSQPDPQCVLGCQTALQTCRLRSETASQGCFTDCDGAITTAEQACASDPGADACTAALQTAQACVRSCNQMEHTAQQACLQTAQGCIAGCPNISPTPAPTATPESNSAAALRAPRRRRH
jgi:hypothetical protein